MKEILEKKVADLSVVESLIYMELIHIALKPTITLDEFCSFIGKDKRIVYSLIKSGVIPQELIVVENDDFGPKKSPLFHKQKVFEWISNDYNKLKFKSSDALDSEIRKFIKKL